MLVTMYMCATDRRLLVYARLPAHFPIPPPPLLLPFAGSHDVFSILIRSTEVASGGRSHGGAPPGGGKALDGNGTYDHSGSQEKHMRRAATITCEMHHV